MSIDKILRSLSIFPNLFSILTLSNLCQIEMPVLRIFIAFYGDDKAGQKFIMFRENRNAM